MSDPPLLASLATTALSEIRFTLKISNFISHGKGHNLVFVYVSMPYYHIQIIYNILQDVCGQRMFKQLNVWIFCSVHIFHGHSYIGKITLKIM